MDGRRARVVSHETRPNPGSGHRVLYIVRVEAIGEAWLLARRFSEFVQLAAKMDSEAKTALPSRITVGNLSLAQRRQRATDLDAWLQHAERFWTEACMREFLEIDVRDRQVYATRTICGQCVVGEGRLMAWIAASLLIRNHRAILESVCKDHGVTSTDQVTILLEICILEMIPTLSLSHFAGTSVLGGADEVVGRRGG